MRRLLYVSLLAVPVLLLGTIGDVGATQASESQGATTLTAILSGANETPPAPDSDLTGTGVVTINESHTQLCWKLRYTTTQMVKAGHIHRGTAGMNGPVVFGFFNPPPTGAPPVNDGCRAGDQSLLDDIAAHPETFYVNVHTKTFPDGAGRGQLSGESESEDDAGSD